MSFLIPSALAESVTTEETPNALATFFQQTFSKFGEIQWHMWLILAVFILLGVFLLMAGKSQKRWNAKMIAYAALSIALSFVLSYVRLYRMPQGGSITPGSMLPLLLFSVSFGVTPGVVAGFAYGILQYLQGGSFLNVWQFLLDYPIAFAMLGLAGLCKHFPKTNFFKSYGMYIAMFIAVLGRCASAVSAGLMWVKEYPVEGQLPFVYSLVYNGTYLIPELIICLVLAVLVGKRVVKLMRAQ